MVLPIDTYEAVCKIFDIEWREKLLVVIAYMKYLNN